VEGSDRWFPRLLGIASAAALLFSLLLPSGALAWSAGCDGHATIFAFAGEEEHHAGTIGAQASVETVNEGLCAPTDGFGSSSSSWVALVGAYLGSGSENDIYQVGIDKCQDPGCPRDPPTTYYFYAYGHHASTACGAEKLPVAVKAPKGDATAYSHVMKVDKVFVSGGANEYRLYVDGAEQNRVLATQLETCWNGVGASEYADEVHDPGDQAGGCISSCVEHAQNFAYVQYRDGLGWHSMNRPFGQVCDVHDLSTMNCNIASNLHDWFYVRDTRAP
jgi:hypothetical protein